MNEISSIIDSLGGNILIAIIVIIGVVIFFKLAKEVLGLAIKIAFIALVIYVLYNYTGLYYYIQGIFSSLNL